MSLISIILLSFFLSGTLLFVKYITKIIIYLLSKFSIKPFKDYDFKEDLLVFVSIFFLTFFFVFFFDSFNLFDKHYLEKHFK